jgi:hypothetical protein
VIGVTPAVRSQVLTVRRPWANRTPDRSTSNRQELRPRSDVGRALRLPALAVERCEWVAGLTRQSRWSDGASNVGDHHYITVLHNHVDKVGRREKLLFAIYGLILVGVQGLALTRKYKSSTPSSICWRVATTSACSTTASFACQSQASSISEYGRRRELHRAVAGFGGSIRSCLAVLAMARGAIFRYDRESNLLITGGFDDD